MPRPGLRPRHSGNTRSREEARGETMSPLLLSTAGQGGRTTLRPWTSVASALSIPPQGQAMQQGTLMLRAVVQINHRKQPLLSALDVWTWEASTPTALCPHSYSWATESQSPRAASAGTPVSAGAPGGKPRASLCGPHHQRAFFKNRRSHGLQSAGQARRGRV